MSPSEKRLNLKAGEQSSDFYFRQYVLIHESRSKNQKTVLKFVKILVNSSG
jgi:hypothetical protein